MKRAEMLALSDAMASDVAALLREGLPQEALRADAAQSILRKIAEAQPVAWVHKTHESGDWLATLLTPEQAAEWNTVHASQPLYSLKGVLDD